MKRDFVFEQYSGRMLTLIADDGTELTCSVLVVYKTREDSDQMYIALLQVKDGHPTDELLLYRFFEEDGAPSLEPIQSDIEYTEAANFLGEYLDEMEALGAAEDGCGCGCGHDHDHEEDHGHGGCSSCGGGCC